MVEAARSLGLVAEESETPAEALERALELAEPGRPRVGHRLALCRRGGPHGSLLRAPSRAPTLPSRARLALGSPPVERTLVICKPDAVERGLIGEIIGRLERKGLRIVAAELRTIDADTASRHYAEHLGKSFYDDLVDSLPQSRDGHGRRRA